VHPLGPPDQATDWSCWINKFFWSWTSASTLSTERFRIGLQRYANPSYNIVTCVSLIRTWFVYPLHREFFLFSMLWIPTRTTFRLHGSYLVVASLISRIPLLVRQCGEIWVRFWYFIDYRRCWIFVRHH
jgi:hypothetical protein